ncbi:MAG TPA: HD domain-containing protein [Anaerolineae bacterium]|nr:HD domain-containing protein [Anaerolineae bacterium]
MDIVDEAATHARKTYPDGDWPHTAEVVTYARQLARRLGADEEIVTIAAYFHDISRATMGPEDHNVKSAEMARAWLRQRGYPRERTERVAAAIMAHMRPVVGPGRERLSLEERILYDADKIGRAQGIGLLAAAVRLGSQITWEDLSYAQLAAVVKRGRDVTQKTYNSLYSDAARELAAAGYKRTIDFCNGLLETAVARS